MRPFHVRVTALILGMAATGLAIGWLADDLRPGTQSFE